jgi:tetratricopeptide (TPR) repeat protein
MRHVVWLSICIVLTGCSGKRAPVATPPPVDLAPAEALLQAGCYRCLTQAYAIFERARTSPAPPPRARDASFVTAMLLALRAKDLDLEATPWLSRARALATTDEAIYLDIVDALPWDAGAAPDFQPPKTLPADTLTRWRMMPPMLHAELDDYVRLTLECRLGTRVSFNATVGTLDMSRPLVQYRAGLCGAEQRPRLERLVASDPRFAEAWYFIGRYEMATGVQAAGLRGNKSWMTTSVKPLSDAHAALADVPTVTTVLAGLMRARGELRRALSLYDEALVLRPTHGEALFGRALTLSYLKRHDEAIAATTLVIERNRGYVPSAYYYRALNEYQKDQLDLAARDVATARRMAAPEEVQVLSGLVAYAQTRKMDARVDFTAAVAGNASRCVAHWYLGILNLDDEAWTPAVSSFSDAAVCYVSAATALKREAEQLPDDLPEDVRAQQATEYQDSIAENTRQAGRAFFNAAQAAMRTGDSATALYQAREALAYDDVRERAEALVQKLQSGDRR